MDPFSLLLLGSTALSAGGSIYGGIRGSQSGRLAVEIARGNAAMLTATAEVQALDAPLAIKRGAFEERRYRASLADVLGGQEAYYAGAGIDPTYGSPLQLAVATAEQGQVDAELMRAQARYDEAQALARSASTQAQAAAQSGQAFVSAERANDALIAGYLGAANAIFTGGAKLYGTGGKGGGGGFGFSPKSWGGWSVGG